MMAIDSGDDDTGWSRRLQKFFVLVIVILAFGAVVGDEQNGHYVVVSEGVVLIVA